MTTKYTFTDAHRENMRKSWTPERRAKHGQHLREVWTQEKRAQWSEELKTAMKLVKAMKS